MEEEKRGVSAVPLDGAAEETAPLAAAGIDVPVTEGVSGAPASDKDVAESAETVSEDEDISARLRRAGDRIDRASTEAEVFKRRRDKESASAELDAEKSREGEKKRIEADLKKREATIEEHRVAMEYAESYRARLRAEKESNALTRRKAEERERARSEERSAREREIAEGIEREREEARARNARAESLLSKIDGSVGAVAAARASSSEPTGEIAVPVSTSSTDGAVGSVTEAAVSESARSADEPVEVAAVSEPTSVAASLDSEPAASAEPVDDYVIRIEDDAPEKDVLYIDGATACEIAVGGAAAVGASVSSSAAAVATAVKAPAPAPTVDTVAEAIPSAPVPFVTTGDEPIAKKATAATSAVDLPATKTPAPTTAAPAAPAATSASSLDATAPDAKEYAETVKKGGDELAAYSLDEYSSMVSAVKGSDIPKAPIELALGTPIGDYEADRELLRHASEVTKRQYVTQARGEDFDVTPRYPDPVGKPLTPKEAKRREKEALAEEKRAMLEFERASRVKKQSKKKEKKKSADERALEEYESAEEVRRAAAEYERKPVTTESKAETAAPVLIFEPESEAAKPASPRTAEPAATAKPTPVFDKKALEKNKKRQTKNDLLLVEHRIYAEIRRLQMDTRTGEISFSARIADAKVKRERSKKQLQLTDAKKRLKLAKKYEIEDNARYYQLVLCDVDRVRLPKRTDREEVRELRERLLALLKTRDELNLKLIELYSLSEGGRSGKAQARFNVELEGRRRAFKRQLPAYRKYERARISVTDKEKLYPLMDERTELHGELARINFMLKKERAKGLARKELKNEKRKVERKLDENKRAILHYEAKALRKAEKTADGNRAAAIGWTALAVIVVAVVLCTVFWKDIQPWLVNTALPWLGDLFGRLVDWVGSLVGGGADATPTDTPTA